jgi:hypothetical protein
MALIRQGSFAGGELSPRLWGRFDLEVRAKGVRRCRDFFVDREGALVSRPGTQYLGLGWDDTAIRLVPFIYSDSQSYVLEFGHLYVRIWSYGARVYETFPTWSAATTYALNAWVLSGGINYKSLQAGNLNKPPSQNPSWWEVQQPVILQVTTPYTAAQVDRLKFAQVGDVLTLAHGSHSPRTLTRASHGSWTLHDLATDFDRPVIVAHPTAVGSYVVDGTPFVGGSGLPAKEWKYLVTQLVKQADGSSVESAPVAVGYKVAHGSPDVYTVIPAEFGVSPDYPCVVQMYPVGSSFPYTVYHRVYRGRGDIFGWVGDTDTWKLTDDRVVPDYTRPPPEGRNPFKVWDQTSALTPTLVRTEYPAVVWYFEERRLFACTEQRPAFIFASATGDYSNFDRRQNFPVADNAGEWELAARTRQEIRSAIVAGGRSILLTNASDWTFGGKGGEPLTPVELPAAKEMSAIGASWVDPLVVGHRILYVRTKGGGVRDLFFDVNQESMVGGDVSRPASHFFEGHTIISWCYSEDPYGVIWAVRDDWQLFSLTYDRDAGVWAWALHYVNGRVLSVCAVPETARDTVYLVVRRDTGDPQHPDRQITIERFADRSETDNVEQVALDGSITYRGGAANVISGLDHLENLTVWVLADGVPCGPFTVGAGQIDLRVPNAGGEGLDPLGSGAAVVHVGLLFQPEMESLDIIPEKGKEKNVSAVHLELFNWRGLVAGEALDATLVPVQRRDVADNYGAVPTDVDSVKVNIVSTWNKGGRVAVRQTAPHFVTILGLTREVEAGGT